MSEPVRRSTSVLIHTTAKILLKGTCSKELGLSDPLRHADGPSSIPAMSEVDLATLLRGASNGDEQCWRGIVQLYARRVYALARSRLCAGAGQATPSGVNGRSSTRGTLARDGLWVHGQDIAEEVTQSVFVTVATKLSSGEYTEQGRFESWLFRVAMNRIRDEVRRARRQAVPTDPEVLDGSTAAGTADQSHDNSDQLSALRQAMQQLSDPDREIIELRHHAGLSFKQMADMLAEPLGTLLARHHRALRKLKELMTGPAGLPVHATGDRS